MVLEDKYYHKRITSRAIPSIPEMNFKCLAAIQITFDMEKRIIRDYHDPAYSGHTQIS